MFGNFLHSILTSPEVVTRSSHGLESDVWSLGCMLFIMLVGHPPFDTKGLKESIFTKVVMGEYKVRKLSQCLISFVEAICIFISSAHQISSFRKKYNYFYTFYYYLCFLSAQHLTFWV